MTTTRRDFLRTGAATLAALPILAATAAQAQTTHLPAVCTTDKMSTSSRVRTPPFSDVQNPV